MHKSPWHEDYIIDAVSSVRASEVTQPGRGQKEEDVSDAQLLHPVHMASAMQFWSQHCVYGLLGVCDSEGAGQCQHRVYQVAPAAKRCRLKTVC